VLEILARSGGAQLTDRIELAEYRAEDDELTEPLDFRIAGASQPDFAGTAALVKAGDALGLKREPENPYDEFATLVLVQGSARTPLGYVPGQYSRMIARLLDQDISLVVTAQRLHVTADANRWVVRIVRA
jgi:HIRAN domain